MTRKPQQRIFVSHSSADNEIVLDIATRIETHFGKQSIWVDLFNLDGGDELADVIPNAIAHSNWFVLIHSQAAAQSRWVQYEASLATFLAIERENFKLLTVRLDESEFPQ
ncbi:MAG: toll/interleukin-1 receptor domain-containing protein, partial [Anaerolineae bacterium]|nr:toll/interleukin-1 receptor domain-containing protein [Anaerolineae bacterium]